MRNLELLTPHKILPLGLTIQIKQPGVITKPHTQWNSPEATQRQSNNNSAA